MEFLLHSPAAHACLGAGLAGLCGFRAFLPIAILGLFANLSLLGAPDPTATSLAFVQHTWAIILFFVLAVAEMGLDKLPVQPLAMDFIFNPLRVLGGALVFAVALAQYGTPALIVGAVAGAAIAFVAHVARGALKPAVAADDVRPTASYLSLFEDIAVIIGALAVLALPWLGIPIVFFVFFLVYRVRVRRKRKYRGLRILKS